MMYKSRDFDLPATFTVACRSGFTMTGTGSLLGDKMTLGIDYENPYHEPSDVLNVTAVNEQGVVTTAQLHEGGLEPPSPESLN